MKLDLRVKDFVLIITIILHLQNFMKTLVKDSKICKTSSHRFRG